MTAPVTPVSRPPVRQMMGIAVRGLAMGAADVVPGVSGGTVAFVTGIYERLVATISAGSRALGRFLRGDISGGLAELRRVDWWFLGVLVLGSAVAVVTLARVIEDLLASHPIRMAALFLGLIAGTVAVAWALLRRPDPRHMLVAGAVGLISFLVFGLQSSTVTDPSLLVYLLAGMLAICAFILPGVSGSFLLLSIGMYQSVLAAVNDRDLAVVAVFGLGAVAGLAVFSQVLERLLERHHDVVLAALIGLMLGSFRILWPWPNGLGDETGAGATVLGAPAGDVGWPIVLAVAGATAVVVFDRWARHRTG